jgi:peptidoglycan/xylan/chitin deacetylase (PgdA/CDA1 family)
MPCPKTFTLNFHAIYNEFSSFHADPVFSVHEDKLRAILSAIRESGKNIRITFDDGHLSDAALVLPLLREYGIPACFFVVGKFLQDDPAKWEQTQELHEAGFTIGAHGYSHCDLTKLSSWALDFEIRESKAIVEACIGKEVVDFALPYGKTNSNVNTQLTAAGFRHIYTTRGRKSAPEDLLIHRLNVKNHTSLPFLRKAIIQERAFYKGFFAVRTVIRNTLKSAFT